MGREQGTRRYRKKERAIKEEETRQRIVDVLVELHGTVGPANTKVTEVAERAGVSRMTVYKHFPTEAAQFTACSTHWFAENPLPDLDSWISVSDAEERLRLGLDELYGWYSRTQDMMDNVLRDAARVPAVREILDVSWWPYVERMVDLLARRPASEGNDRDRRAALRLAIDFRTWRLLTGAGLSQSRAVGLAARFVRCASEPAVAV